jgi:hypothetical protein
MAGQNTTYRDEALMTMEKFGLGIFKHYMYIEQKDKRAQLKKNRE